MMKRSVLVILILSLYSPLAFAAISDYTGVYSGTINGDDYGPWLAVVESNGHTKMLFYSNIYGVMDGSQGYYVNDSGNLSAVSLGNMAEFYVTFYRGGSVAGTWTSGYYASGTISGSIQTNNSKYAGTYTGTIAGADSGSWTIVIDNFGLITGSGSSQNVGLFSVDGAVDDSGQFMGVTEVSAAYGSISGNALSGLWFDNGVDYGGTFNGIKQVERPSNSPPVASIGGPYFGKATFTLTFNGTGSSDPDGNIVTYSWDFGDGSFAFGATPEHSYDVAGVYTVVLTVSDQAGLEDSVETTVTIPNSNIPGTALYRFWSNQNQAHFYTITEGERDYIIANYSENVWKFEAIAFYAYAPGEQPTGAYPLYRFWSDQNQAHFYTISEEEKNYILANYPEKIWRYEAIAYYAFAPGEQPPETKPVYRFWSDQNQIHFYTISEEEKNYIITNYPEEVWKYEAIAWYAYPN